MAISLRATSTGPNNLGTSTTITLPVGTTINDVTTIGFSHSAGTATVPVGWTVVCNANGSGAVYRVFQSGDPSSVTFTSATSAYWMTVSASYIGCDPAAPVDASNSCYFFMPSLSATINSLYVAPPINPSWQNDQLVVIYGNQNQGGAGTITLPAGGGFTSRVTSSGGPSLMLADKTLGTSNTPTGYQIATWRNASGDICMGAQIALKTAGASAVTPVAPRITFSSIIHTQGSTININSTNPLPGDLVCIFGLCNGGVFGTLPSGYTVRGNLNNTSCLLTRVFQAGDADPVLPPSGNVISQTVCLRTTGTGGTPPTFDQTANAGGVGSSPTTATLPSLVPINSTEYLIAAWISLGSPGTFTPPGGLASVVNYLFGPSIWIGDTQPAANPTGTLAGQFSAGTASFVAAYEMLVSNAAAVVGGGTQARAMVLA